MVPHPTLLPCILNTMKYGNLSIPIPSMMKEDRAALADLLEKGEIDQAEYAAKIRTLNRNGLMFIAQSNSYNAPKRRRKGNMGNFREEFTRSKTMEIAQDLAQNMVQASEPSKELTVEDVRDIVPRVLGELVAEVESADGEPTN